MLSSTGPKIDFDADLEKNESQAPSIKSKTDDDIQRYHSDTLGISNRYNASRDMSENTAAASVKDPGPPPDGGLLAWIQVAMAHLVVLNTWGTINSFGIFQTYYTSALSRPPSDISWIGSIQVFLLFFIGTLTGRLTDAGYFRHVFMSGSFLVVFGSLMASLSTTYEQLFMSQGVCIGLGMGCLFCPIVAVLCTFFVKKRNLAIGLSISGSATGGVIFPLMVRQLLPQIGFSWTMRCIALVQFVSILVANIFVRTRIQPRKTGPLVEWSAFKEGPYSFFVLGSFFNFWGVYIVFYYIGAFSRDTLGYSYHDSINLLVLMNGIGAIGRILPGLIADRWCGPLHVIIPASFICMVLLYSWNSIHSYTGIYSLAVIYGIFGATVQGIFPAALSSMTLDISKSGMRMGMAFSIVAFANLSGPPIAGALIRKANGGYLYAFVFAGTCLCLGTIFSIICRIVKGGFVLRVKI
ncbi:MFS monocarboxylate transporter-2 [Coleophoma crateriformis]|uniref:MFS monocarboxylate transporter-2 n=1 Tax=Coleophoma crateriformis TaxID=565419 RepID=A0A3D8Q7J8_9HELO|nr:MFS monocarboxylate transporter-2 [Coleophoma crateriformis]